MTILIKSGENKDKETKPEGGEGQEDPGYTEKEIRQVYYAMVNGTIEAILQGEKDLEDEPWEEDEQIPEVQREKTLEIIAYIKKQTSLRQ